MRQVWTVILFLALTGCEIEENASAALKNTEPAYDGAQLFSKVSAESSGVDFVNKLPLDLRVNIFTYEYFYNGGGVAVGDIDNDGLNDIYFTSNLGDNKLYLNKGTFKFQDITKPSNTAGKSGWSTGVTMADVNADGWLDIYVCRSGKFNPENRENELFINNGDHTFSEQAARYGLNDPAFSTQALFFDYDLDGDLDMYLLNHSTQNFQGKYIKEWLSASDPNSGDKLYRNDGHAFTDVTSEAGIETTPMGYGLGVAAGDLNSDGWPDLYVTNDYVEHDYMYINQKNGTFVEAIHEATRHTSNFSMGVDIGDINNDGLEDIGVLDMVAEDNYRQKTNMASMNPQQFYQAVDYGFHHQYMFNTLQLNRGHTKFSDIAQLAGVSNTDWSWAILFEDLNNDGWKDIFVTNGFRKEFGNKDFVKYRQNQMATAQNASREVRIKVIQALLDTLKDGQLNNYVFENNRDLTFKKRNADWGIKDLTYSNGGILADLDNDGDLDMVVNNIDQLAGLYKNHASDSLNFDFLQVAFKGPAKNPFGLGAVVELKIRNQIQRKTNYTTRGYQSSVPPYLHFGLGESTGVDELKVTWPDGNYQVIANPNINERVTVDYADNDGKYQKPAFSPLFKEVTQERKLEFDHKENEYDDFSKEVLLPHKMSQFGPALASGDVNGDSLDDIFVGGALGFSAMLFVQLPDGTFEKSSSNLWDSHKSYEDVGAHFFDADGDQDMDLYVVSGGNEFNKNDVALEDRLYINDKGNFKYHEDRLPDVRISGSVVISSDIDSDGDLDLFVGGRLIPASYPYPASSQLLLNDGNGVFSDITQSASPDLFDIGMITSAVWTDYDGDNDQDLALAGEWTSVMIFENNDGKFSLVEDEIRETKTGWWYGLHAADIDGDDDEDLLVGNLGLNYKYKASESEPFKVYADDFDGNGSTDIVLGYYNDGKLFPLRGRQCSSDQMPVIKQEFKSYHDFGMATLNDVYGEDNLEEALNYAATTFASGIYINHGQGNFEFVELPTLAQLSSINDFVVADFNADGIRDIILAGNLYPAEVETTRNDASYGLYLVGAADGNFKSLDLKESGLNLGGDVKHLEKIRLSNGKVGIVAALNNGPLKLITLND